MLCTKISSPLVCVQNNSVGVSDERDWHKVAKLALWLRWDLRAWVQIQLLLAQHHPVKDVCCLLGLGVVFFLNIFRFTLLINNQCHDSPLN